MTLNYVILFFSYIDMTITTKQVKFSRFEIIHRYSWIPPVDGFQTKLEFFNSKQSLKSEKKNVQLENYH